MLSWTAEYALDIPVVDAEHQQLIGMMNKLEGATGQPNHAQIVRGVIDEINAYVVQHFRTEEELMQQAGYPRYEEHRATHKDFARKVQDLKLFAGIPPNDLHEILLTWLLEHILKADRDYAPYVKEYLATAA